jgi:hypothetical protein
MNLTLMENRMANANKKVQQKVQPKAAELPVESHPVVELPVESQPVVESTPTPEPEPVQLTVTDLQSLGRIVDLASRRGAFQAAELTIVGETYNKLAAFLAWVESEEKKKEAKVA